MAVSIIHIFLTTMFVVAHTAIAESSNLQDLCVADHTGVKVNGFPCKDPAKVTPDDFYSIALANVNGAASNSTTGTAITGASVEKIPGLNFQGVSMARIDFAPGGIIAPHYHPRATEMVYVLEGRLVAGFLTTHGKHISKNINKGDVFVFPRGLVHFQQNPNNAPASVLAAFESQLPGTVVIPLNLFGANPPVSDDLLAKAFHVGPQDVQKIKGKFGPKH